MSWVNHERLNELNDHSPVLFVLLRLAPNGDPNMLRLADLLMRLHDVFGIFPDGGETYEAKLWLPTGAALAADRWRVLCKHCLMLVKSNTTIPVHCEGLSILLAAMKRPESEPTAATASVTDSLPGLDGTTPQGSMLGTENQQPAETPLSMGMAQETPNQTAATARRRVEHHDPCPYPGVIDRSGIEDDLPPASEADKELEVEVPELDFDNTRCFEVESKVESKVESEVESKV